jgi:hypothetical protein
MEEANYMADNIRKLLDFIIENRLTPEESREAQLVASVEQDVPSEIEAQVRSHYESAERLAPYFAQGLKQALGAGGRLVIDDTDPAGNGIAEAFARFLVVPNLATSQSEELPGGGFRYTFELDWASLRAIAQSLGFDLDAALRES